MEASRDLVALEDEHPRTAGSPLAAVAAATEGAVGQQSSSAKHALMRGLRLRGNESQVTQAIAAIAQADPGFARALVRLILDVAQSDGRHAANVALMGDPPADLSCQAEHSVYDEYDFGLGRVDLRFDGGEDFTLFVENKLHSGFGPEQLLRYQAALGNLPEERRRAGLVAITCDVPSKGELDAGASGWLGAVRWARLYDEGLPRLPIADPDVRVQWQLLVDILHDQGDLGLTAVDTDLIRAWSRYEDGQAHLTAILSDVRQRALDILRDRLKAKRYRGFADREAIAGLHFFGQREAVPMKTEKGAVWTGFRVPASINRPAVRLSFWSSGDPMFSIEVAPWLAADRLEDGDRQLLGAARRLAQAGFQGGAHRGDQVWWTEYKPADYIDAKDVPARLLTLIDKDITVIVESGVLAFDLKAAAAAGRNGPPTVRASQRKRR